MTLHGNREARDPFPLTWRARMSWGALSGGAAGVLHGLIWAPREALLGPIGWGAVVGLELVVGAALGALGGWIFVARSQAGGVEKRLVTMTGGAVTVLAVTAALHLLRAAGPAWQAGVAALGVLGVWGGGRVAASRSPWGSWAVAGAVAASVAALALVASPERIPPGPAASAKRPLVVWITVAGLRADRTEGARVDTSSWDRLVREGASAGLTVGSGSDLKRGVRDLLGGEGDGVSLGEAVARRQWPALAVVGSSEVMGDADLVAGFQRVDQDHGWPSAWDATLLGRATGWWDRPEERRSDRVVDRAIQAVDRMPGAGLLWVHLHDPMPPWRPPEPYGQRYAPEQVEVGPPLAERGPIHASHRGDLDALTDPRVAVARYDGEVAWTDRHLGRLLDHLKASGREASTLVVAVGLHGMALDEGPVRFGPSDVLVDGMMRVPMVMRLPGVIPRGSHLDAVVTLPDVAATVRDLLGLEEVDSGVSLREAWASGALPRDQATVRIEREDELISVGWRAPGQLIRWSRDEGWQADRFPLEADSWMEGPRLARILRTLEGAPAPDTAEVDRLLQGLRPPPSFGVRPSIEPVAPSPEAPAEE